MDVNSNKIFFSNLQNYFEEFKLCVRKTCHGQMITVFFWCLKCQAAVHFLNDRGIEQRH